MVSVLPCRNCSRKDCYTKFREHESSAHGFSFPRGFEPSRTTVHSENQCERGNYNSGIFSEIGLYFRLFILRIFFSWSTRAGHKTQVASGQRLAGGVQSFVFKTQNSEETFPNCTTRKFLPCSTPTPTSTTNDRRLGTNSDVYVTKHKNKTHLP